MSLLPNSPPKKVFPVEIQHLHIILYCKIRYHSMFIIEMEEENKNGCCSRLFRMKLLHGMHHPIFHHIMTNDFTCINMHKPIWTYLVTHRVRVTRLSKNIIELLFRIWWIPVRIDFLIFKTVPLERKFGRNHLNAISKDILTWQ